MNEDTLNIEVRRFLKNVVITSQREIEHAVNNALEEGKLDGSKTFEIKMTLESSAIGIRHCIEEKIALE